MPFFKKKPVVIEAVEFTNANKDVAFNFVQGNGYADFDAEGNPVLKIQTLEGMMTASLGDWIIKGVSGEYYPCKPEIFTKTYDFVDAESPKNILPLMTTNGMRFNPDGSIADDAIIPNRDWKFGSIQYDEKTQTRTVLANNTNPIDSCGNQEK